MNMRPIDTEQMKHSTAVRSKPCAQGLRQRFAARLAQTLALLACLILPATVMAQATAGRASSIIIPDAAKTASFDSEVWVRNPSSTAIDVDVLFYEAVTVVSPATPGLKNCGFLTIAPTSVVSFKLGTQCPTLGAGSHYGILVLRDRAVQKINSFAAYSRAQHVTTNQGFSIEGFPEHVFSVRTAGVNGLKRKAASVPPTQAQPGYQPVCYIGALGEPVDYSVTVREGIDNSQVVGSIVLTGSLAPYELYRYIDIFGSAGLPPGDKENVRVTFANTNASAPTAFIAFCTQQDNFSFGADFRIAKTDDEANITKLLTRCRGTSDPSCSTLTAPASYSIPNATTQHRFSMFIHHPDYLRCDIVGPNAGNLEIRLLAPAPNGSIVGPAVAGGTDASFFYYETGPRNAVVNAGGFQTFWNLEVGARESAPPTFPADYGLKCVSGSGIHISGGTSSVTDDF
jgi:hypothetical protein